MTCTEDLMEGRYAKEINLEESSTADLFKYYHTVYKKGNHEYRYDVK